MTEQTLLLNASYEILDVIHWHRAMTLLAQEKIEILEHHEREARTPRMVFRIPSVVRLLHYVRSKGRQIVPFTRENVFVRDHWSCQYCGHEAKDRGELTFDHVIPQSRGGSGGWDNIVASCGPCNKKKADKTPEEAGMALKRRPRRPVALPTSRVSAKRAPVSWRSFLFLD